MKRITEKPIKSVLKAVVVIMTSVFVVSALYSFTLHKINDEFFKQLGISKRMLTKKLLKAFLAAT